MDKKTCEPGEYGKHVNSYVYWLYNVHGIMLAKVCEVCDETVAASFPPGPKFRLGTRKWME